MAIIDYFEIIINDDKQKQYRCSEPPIFKDMGFIILKLIDGSTLYIKTTTVVSIEEKAVLREKE